MRRVFLIVVVCFACIYSYVTAQDTVDIDLLVVYTTDVNDMLVSYGDSKPASEEIAEAYQYTQSALYNSDVYIRLNLIDTIAIDFTLSGNDGESLQWLSTPDDGHGDVVHTLRDSLAADIVVLLAGGGSVNGIGGWPHNNSTEWETEAFCIVFTGNDMTESEDRTFAHEIGHLLGAQHDWYHSLNLPLLDKDDPNNYIMQNRGFIHFDKSDSTGFYTIMSYSVLCFDLSGNCDAIPYYSNPNRTYNGIPMGVEAPANYWEVNNNCFNNDTSILSGNCPADVASIFNWMAPTIASYRSVDGPDGKITDLEAAHDGSIVIDLSFLENSTNETGYRIFRSTDAGMNFWFLDSIEEGKLSYSDTLNSAITYGQSWIYRLQAYNEFGFTTYMSDTVPLSIQTDLVNYTFEDQSLDTWDNDELHPWKIAERKDGTGYAIYADTTLEYMGIGGPAFISKTVKTGNGFISFQVNSNTLMRFDIDDVPVDGSGWSLTDEWDTMVVPVAAGEHTLSWIFYGGGDVWIDEINYPDQETFTVTYLAGEGGTIEGDTSQQIMTGENSDTIYAVAETGYHFTGWDDDIPDNPRVDTNVTANITVLALFEPDTFEVVYLSQLTGSLLGDSLQKVSYGSDGTAIEAISDLGYHFASWDDGVADNPRTDLNVTADITVLAMYEPDTLQLEYLSETTGSLSGDSVQMVPYGTDGSSVEAIPNMGYHFIGWSDGSTDNPRIDLNVTQNILVTARFDLNSGYSFYESENILVYPNPSGDVLEIRFNDKSAFDNIPYSIYTINSGLVMQGTLNKERGTINISQLESSIYFLLIKNNDQIYRIKFVKE